MTNKIRSEFVSMTTLCAIDFFDVAPKVAEHCAGLIKQNTRRLEQKYNFHHPESMLNQHINTRSQACAEIRVDDETVAVLAQVRALGVATNGHFDITVGTLKNCYRQPDREAMEACLSRKKPWVGLEHWAIEDNRLFFHNPHTQFDLGGVIKEFAVDEAARILHEQNVRSAIVNFGGDVRVIGRKPDGSLFGVAIKNPRNRDDVLAVVNLENQALTTSGSYERVHRVGDATFSHILSPRAPSSAVISATLIGATALRCGAFSTAFMLDTDISIPDDLRVVLVDSDLRLHQNIVS